MIVGQDRDIFDDDFDENDAPGPGSYYNSAAHTSFKDVVSRSDENMATASFQLVKEQLEILIEGGMYGLWHHIVCWAVTIAGRNGKRMDVVTEKITHKADIWSTYNSLLCYRVYMLHVMQCLLVDVVAVINIVREHCSEATTTKPWYLNGFPCR